MVELQILNKILRTKSMQIVILNGYDITYFPNFSNEFLFIKEHYDKYNTVPDLETFVDKFPNFNFFDVKESDDYLADKMADQYTYTALVPELNKAIKLLEVKDVSKGTEKLLTIASDLSKLRRTEKTVDLIADASIRFEEYLKRTRDLNKYYITTGWQELDKLTGGWDVKQDLVIISGRPGTGKSWMLFKSALSAAIKGHRVGIYSGEMAVENVGYRVDTLMYHISNWSISHGDISVQVDYETAINNLKNDVKGCIKVLTPKVIGGPATVSKLRAFIEREDLDILFIDQYSLLRDERNGKDRVNNFANISRDLMNLQALKQMPIIIAAQLNRASVDKDNTKGQDLQHLAGADNLGQDASKVIAIEEKDRILTLNVLKDRFGMSHGKLSYLWDKNLGKFDYSPTEVDGLKGESTGDVRAVFQENLESNF